MKRSALHWLVAASTWATTHAFPFGPGSCETGGGVDGPHILGLPGAMGRISVGSYEVLLDGSRVRHGVPFKAKAGVDYDIELRVTDDAPASVTFRGFLLRLGGGGGDASVDTAQFLTPLSPLAQNLVYCECIAVASLAHNSNEDLTTVSGTLNIPTSYDYTRLDWFDLEVTIVQETNSATESSTWFYSKFSVELDTPLSPPSAPPTQAPTPTPTRNPTSNPTVTPSTLPPTVEPTTEPTMVPSTTPSNAPSFTETPATLPPTASLAPTSAGPSSVPSLNPTLLPSNFPSASSSFAPSHTSSTESPSSTPSTLEPTLNNKTLSGDSPVSFVPEAGVSASSSEQGTISPSSRRVSRQVILTTTILLLGLLFVCAVGTVWTVYRKSKQETQDEDEVPSMIATRPVREGTSMSCSITNAETCTLPSQQPKVHIDNLDLLRTSAPSIARAKKAAAKSPRSRTITVPSDSVSSPRAAHDDQPKKKKSSSDLSRTPATAMTRQSISTRMSSC